MLLLLNDALKLLLFNDSLKLLLLNDALKLVLFLQHSNNINIKKPLFYIHHYLKSIIN